MNKARNANVVSKHLNLNADQLDLLHKVLSGLLPHDNYDGVSAGALQRELFTLLPIDEVYGANYLFYKMLYNVDAIRNSFTTSKLALQRENFDSCMQHYVGVVIRKPEFNATMFFSQLGRELNLGNTEEYQEACDMVYTYAMDMYDELFRMAIPSSEAYTYLLPLRENLKISIIERSMNIEAEVLKSSVVFNGTTYSGPDDALLLRKRNQDEIDIRFAIEQSAAHQELDASSFNKVMQYNKEHPNTISPLAYFGYEPVDNVFPMRTQDIICLVADEGVGKTKISMDWVHTLIVAGVNVAVICGETDVQKYTAFLTLNHIYSMEHKTFTYDEFNHRDKIPHESLEELEQWNILIDGCQNDLFSNPSYGKLILTQNLNYEDFYSYAKDKVLRFGTSVIVVDHVAILNSSGARTSDGYLDNDKKRIDWLYRQEDVLTKEFGLCFINTIHTQNEASDKISSGKKVGIRVAGGSRSTTKYGTLVMLLRTTEELERQSIFLLEFKKVRDFQKPPTIALCRNGLTGSHWFNPGMQHYVTGEVDKITQTRIDELIGTATADPDEDDDDELGLDI